MYYTAKPKFVRDQCYAITVLHSVFKGLRTGNFLDTFENNENSSTQKYSNIFYYYLCVVNIYL